MTTLNRAQFARLAEIRREVRDILLGTRIITRKRMPKPNDTFSFAKDETGREMHTLTFAQLVARRVAKKAMG